jgi:hypothetical protein
MTKAPKRTKSQSWFFTRVNVRKVARDCRAGDCVDCHDYHVGTQDTLRRILAARRLTLMYLGEKCFVMPDHEQLYTLRRILHADEIATIQAMAEGLKTDAPSLLKEIFAGPPPAGLQTALKDAARHEDKIPPPRPKESHSERVQMLGSKLSKLQRGLLTWAGSLGRKAPVNLLPAELRTSTPALSRAWRRLQERGLIKLDKEVGRLRHVTLTDAGQELLGC